MVHNLALASNGHPQPKQGIRMKLLATAVVLAFAFSATSHASDLPVSPDRYALAVDRLETTNVAFGVTSGQSATNPYAAVYGASFFTDASTHYSRRLTLRDAISGQFQVRCDNVPTGVIAYRSGGGGMVFTLAPDPNLLGSPAQFWKLDPLTCGYTSLQPASPFGGTVTGASFDATGRMWFAGPGTLYQVSTDTGQVISQTPIAASASASSVSIAFDHTGAFFLAADAHLYRWNQAPTGPTPPAPSSDVDLNTLLPSGSTFGTIAALSYTDRAQLLVIASQLDQGGMSTSYKAYQFAPLLGTLTESAPTFAASEGMFSASAFPAAASLVMSMTLGQTGKIDPGTQLPWTITVRNDGPHSAINATFVNNLPPHLRFIPYTEAPGSNRNCSAANGYGVPVTCAISLAPGQTATYTLLTELEPTFLNGRESNYAQVTAAPFSPSAVAGNNSGRPGFAVSHEIDDATVSYVVGPSSHLEATMTGNPFAMWVGDNVTYTIAVRNTGPSTTSGVTVTDTLPAGLSPVSASGQAWTCTLNGQQYSCTYANSVSVNQSVYLTVVAKGDVAGTYTNRCTATSGLLDPSPSDTCSAQTSVRVLPTSAPPIVAAVNSDTSCPLQFIDKLALKEIAYDLNTSTAIGGLATLTYPPAVHLEGAEIACYTQRGNENSRVLMPACTFDQAGPGGSLLTSCQVSTPGAVQVCYWRAYVRAGATGTYPLDFGLRLFGNPDTTSSMPLRMPVIPATDYITFHDFDSRQRPDEPTMNCQFQ